MIKINSKFLIKLKDQDEFDITEKLPNVVYLGGDSTPIFNNLYQDNTIRDGSIYTGINFGKLIFTANFLLKSSDYFEQKLLRHEIYQIFGDRNLVRIRADIDLQKVMYARPASFDIKFISDGNNDSLFSIQFEIPSGYKYSLKRSDQIMLDDISMGMNVEMKEFSSYIQSSNQFRIYNPSDIAIDPYYQKHDLVIMAKYNGNFYQIINKSNGTSYKYNGSSQGNDSLILNGVSTIFNEKPNSQNSDYGFIRLEKGWNDITVLGATSHETTFSFPFIYID